MYSTLSCAPTLDGRPEALQMVRNGTWQGGPDASPPAECRIVSLSLSLYSLSLSIYIYIYNMYVCVSLSLYIYIYT